jgi:SAM-dependent methyltransferase
MNLPPSFRTNAGAEVPTARHCPAANDGYCHFGAATPLNDQSGLVPGVCVTRCQHCGIGITLPPIPDVSFLYADRLSQDFQPDTAGLARLIKTVAFRHQARTLLRRMGKPAGRIVDFGCGSGLFTRSLGDVAKDAEVIGTDFHPTPPTALSDRLYRSADEASSLAGTADAVIAMHVLEHDDDTGALLARIASHARPGGLVMLEVPNVDCFWISVFGRFWDAWYAPYHRVHFTRASLRSAVEAGGLTVVGEGSACVPTMGRTIANLLGRRNTLFFILLSAVLHPVQRFGEALTRRPSALQVLARKPARSDPVG